MANLKLKPAKCIIIPLACTLTDEIVQQIQDWLTEHIPDWKHFKIRNAGKYLGFYIGPAARGQQHTSTTAKVAARTQAIAGSHAPISVSCSLYNSRAVSVTQYISQLLPLPSSHHNTEKGYLHKLFHMPNNALPLAAFFALPHLGGPHISSIADVGLAARFRTAVRTITSWPIHIYMLMSLALEHTASERYDEGHHYAVHFDRPPIAYYMQAAYDCVFNLVHAVHRHAAQPLDLHYVLSTQAAAKLRALRLGAAPHMQSKVVAIVQDLRFTMQDWTDLFIRRLSPHLLPSQRADLQLVPWSEVYSIMNMLGHHHAMILIKSYTASWCTSHRFKKETLLTCVFGCQDSVVPNIDKFMHYLYCPVLWSSIAIATSTSMASHPLARLGLLPPHPGHMLKTLIAFSMYHDMKLTKTTPSIGNIWSAAAIALRTTSWTTRAVARDALRLLHVDHTCSSDSSSSSEATDGDGDDAALHDTQAGAHINIPMISTHSHILPPHST